MPAEKAVRLQTASRQQINDTRRLKEQLRFELPEWTARPHLKPAEAAQRLMVSHPHVWEVVSRKTAKFANDTLESMLSQRGQAGPAADG